ncbi:ras-domain-containing protein [Glonium stellatum]|uniref:Ras-domain-containing protein n=1 Tax=Glonium stellatum TaxID=574774 RepID=A0A8E2EWF7_9PEZI|nr:ras-domain-containing protein [Glonium stellatum]
MSQNRTRAQAPDVRLAEGKEAPEEPKPQARHRKSLSLASLFRIRGKREKGFISQDGRLWQFDEKATGGVRLKLVVVGDGACGKTCFIIVGTKKLFPTVYVPTIFENYEADFEINGRSVEAHFWDTAGQDEFARLRPSSYPGTHIVCLCFALDDHDSLDNILHTWQPEIAHFCGKKIPIFLLGLKKDTRDDPISIGERLRRGQRHVTKAEGEDMRQKLNAVKYMESSAKTGEGVQETLVEIFTTALEQNSAMHAAAKKKRKRAIHRLFG